jgi:hypothetical protein
MAQTYAHDMRAAAYRHLQAGEHLRSTDRKDVAGYLFGIAAECALKQMMLASGMRPRREEERRNDPFYAHFEALKSMLRDSAYGRLINELRRYAESSTFMQHWDISMRYSHGKDVRSDWVDRWYSDAKDVTGAMDN